MTDSAIRHEVVVQASREQAFLYFVDRVNDWWPTDHSIGSVARNDVVIEPSVGGIVYEVGDDGSRCQWGEVVTWDPPARLAVAWMISPSWQFDPDRSNASEYTVDFEEIDASETRVVLVHSHFERHGAGGDQLRAAVDGPGGWPLLLTNLTEIAARVSN